VRDRLVEHLTLEAEVLAQLIDVVDDFRARPMV
jgi:hypothetical protein